MEHGHRKVVSFPDKTGDLNHSYVNLPEGRYNIWNMARIEIDEIEDKHDDLPIETW